MRLTATVGLSCLLSVAPLGATYSIVACERATRQCGVAVQTDNLAVGASVPAAQAGVGAVASQFETHPQHGSRGLALLAQRLAPDAVLRILLNEDGGFEGRGPEARQVVLVSVDGTTAVHTGTDAAAADWAGARSGPGFSVQGNGLAGPQVLVAMERAFLAASGPLADRLLAALRAGDAAGGQRTGRQSAALLVRTPDGFPLDVDLRVDDAVDPVGSLARLVDLQASRQLIIQARLTARRGNTAGARALLAAGAARAHAWPRALVMAAEVATELEDPVRAVRDLTVAFARDPGRRSVALGRGAFAALGYLPGFHRWIDADLRRGLRADERALRAAPQPSVAARVNLGARLLEAGEARATLDLLDAIAPADADVLLLRAYAWRALGRVDHARDACRAGLAVAPGHPRLTRLVERLGRTPVSAPRRAVPQEAGPPAR
jgi:uncharacterized Ntn-hydrolase superfamily protein